MLTKQEELKVLAMFVPKRQNLSQAPRDRFNIASAARPKRDLSEKQLAAARANLGNSSGKDAA